MKTMKVNITFPVEVVLEAEPDGYVNVANLVAPYLEFLEEAQLTRAAIRGNYFQDWETRKWVPTEQYLPHLWDPAKEDDLLMRLKEKEVATMEGHRRWEAQKDLQCRDLYQMSWYEFKKLSWEQQQNLRAEKGVAWENGQWVKKPKSGEEPTVC